MKKSILYIIAAFAAVTLTAACTERPLPAPVIVLEKTEYEASTGEKITVSPSYRNVVNATFSWTQGAATISTDSTLIFSAEKAGSYIIALAVTTAGGSDNATISVNVTRRADANSSAACDTVFDYTPAPGQFVNSGYDAKTMAEACAYAQSRLAEESYVSLGAYGGYIVVGFDHSIFNDGGYDISVKGNSFDGSSEPGIVMVMKDENANGLPDDTWYELKGSDYDSTSTIKNYSIEYYRPSAPAMPVTWKDSQSESGQVDYLAAFHKQDYYYPAWIESNTLKLTGTRLKSKSYDKSGTGTYWVNPSFGWGYADNYSTEDRLSDGSNLFRISDAVTADGKPADLQYIDFVKVYTAVLAQCGWIGELSTEISGIYDYNMTEAQ